MNVSLFKGCYVALKFTHKPVRKRLTMQVLEHRSFVGQGTCVVANQVTALTAKLAHSITFQICRWRCNQVYGKVIVDDFGSWVECLFVAALRLMTQRGERIDSSRPRQPMQTVGSAVSITEFASR